MSLRSLVIHGYRIAPDEEATRWMLCLEGVISETGVGDPPQPDEAVVLDAGGHYLLPGFIDVHVHGSAGFDTMDAAPDALHGMARFFAQHGVTAFLATTWSDTGERITAAVQAVEAAMQSPWEDGAQLLGVHLEGPYLNPARCGAQNASVIRRALPDEYLPWLNSGVIRLVSLAPEYDENRDLLRQCVRRGIVVSAAHTDATYEQMIDAIDLGLNHSTHTFNAMRPLNHRDPGVVGAVMADDRVRCELIADGIHVHPGAMRALQKAKTMHGIILITDAMRAAGLPDGEYTIDAGTVTLHEGAVRLPNGTLAGSALTFDAGVRRFLYALGYGSTWMQYMDWVHSISSWNAAFNLGLYTKGTLNVNGDADLVLVDADFNVQTTIVDGLIVYTKEA